MFFFLLRRLNDAAQKNRKSLVEAENSSDGGGDEIIPRSQSGISVRSRRSIPSQKSNSKNSVDEEPMLIAAELHDLPEGSESGDSETATEVDVSWSLIKQKKVPIKTNYDTFPPPTGRRENVDVQSGHGKSQQVEHANDSPQRTSSRQTSVNGEWDGKSSARILR